MYHRPVLLDEAIDLLKCEDKKLFVDCTLGGGGHTTEILEKSGPLGRVIAFDRDENAIRESVERLKKFGDRVKFVHAQFSNSVDELKKLGIDSVDGVLADLGVSSHQFDEANRGFSFQADAPLDMRMDATNETSAEDIINSADEKELADMFFELGEERLSRRIARAIVYERQKKRITTTLELAEIVKRSYPPKMRYGRIHPATKVFQALRIFVNNELGELRTLLAEIPSHLSHGGRFVVISYHSLEDRLVKQRFNELGQTDEFRKITKKPVMPSEKEIEENRRARSAKMRCLERI